MNSVSSFFYGFKRQSLNILLPDWNLPSLSISGSQINANDQGLMFRTLLHIHVGDEEGIVATVIEKVCESRSNLEVDSMKSVLRRGD